MVDGSGLSSSPEISVVYASSHDPSDIDAAVAIGNQSSDTLGLLPVAAYREAAERRTLLLARAGERVVGYALYGLAKNRVRLTHLCVERGFRGLGIARQMVEHLSEQHRDYLGIHVRCRRDYELAEMWIKLGFSQRSEQPGRGKGSHVLVNWWHDHGYVDLFTQLDEAALVRAAIDLNVLRDLVDPLRTDTRDVQSLIGDQVRDRLELVRTGALDAEINSMDGELRRRCTERAQLLTTVRADQARVGAVHATLAHAAGARIVGYPRSPQDEFDLRHVAEACAADLNVFITRDEQLRHVFAEIAEPLFGLRILGPMEVVTHLDELVRAEAYRPASLLDTSLSKRVLGLGYDDALRSLTSSAHGERVRDFQRLVRELVLTGRDRIGLFAADGTLIAVYCAYPEGDQLMVPLVRLADNPLAATLAWQLLFMLRQQSRVSGTPVIRLTDPHISHQVRLAALQDGFHASDGHLLGYGLDVCGPAELVGGHAVRAARAAGQAEPPRLRSDLPAAATAELERIWWPAKITDSRLPNYLIPIRQAYSASLLGVPTTLLLRTDTLGLSREHVYYRSRRGVTPQAPARLLWYMSSDPASPYGSAVVACSQLEAVTSAEPGDLHSRFLHLGVWGREQVRQAAKDGMAQALVFINTEQFPQPISLTRLRQLAEVHEQPYIPQQPLRISSEFFAAVYQEGHIAP